MQSNIFYGKEIKSGKTDFLNQQDNGHVQENYGKIIEVKKDIVAGDHILEKGDLVKVNGTKMEASSFILDDPIVIDNYYIEKGDTITVIKSKRDSDNKNKKDDADKINKTDKEDDTVDVELKEKVIIGKYIFEIGDKIKIIPQSKNTSVSRMNERVFRTNKNLTIDGKTIVEGSLIEFLKKDKKPVINISGSDVNILRETWV